MASGLDTLHFSAKGVQQCSILRTAIEGFHMNADGDIAVFTTSGKIIIATAKDAQTMYQYGEEVTRFMQAPKIKRGQGELLELIVEEVRLQ